MKKEYDFKNAKRGAVVPQKGKTRITICIDIDVLEEFRSLADSAGYWYQTMINAALRLYVGNTRSLLMRQCSVRSSAKS
jgi:uncharacterized protein (DUF4415 family)